MIFLLFSYSKLEKQRLAMCLHWLIFAGLIFASSYANAKLTVRMQFQNTITFDLQQTIATKNAIAIGLRETLTISGTDGGTLEIFAPTEQCSYDYEKEGSVPSFGIPGSGRGIIESDFATSTTETSIGEAFKELGYLTQEQLDNMTSNADVVGSGGVNNKVIGSGALVGSSDTEAGGGGDGDGDNDGVRGPIFLQSHVRPTLSRPHILSRRLLEDDSDPLISEACQGAEAPKACELARRAQVANQNKAIKDLLDLQGQVLTVRGQTLDFQRLREQTSAILRQRNISVNLLLGSGLLNDKELDAIRSALSTLNNTYTFMQRTNDEAIARSSTVVKDANARAVALLAQVDAASALLELTVSFSLNTRFIINQTLIACREALSFIQVETTFALQRGIEGAHALLNIKNVLHSRKDQQYMALTTGLARGVDAILANDLVLYARSRGSPPAILPFSQRNHIVGKFMVFDANAYQWRFTVAMYCNFQKLAFAPPARARDLINVHALMSSCGGTASVNASSAANALRHLSDADLPCTCFAVSWNQTIKTSNNRLKLAQWLADPSPSLADNNKFLEPVNETQSATASTTSVYSQSQARVRYVGQDAFCGIFTTTCAASNNVVIVTNDQQRQHSRGQAMSGVSCSCDPQDAVLYALRDKSDGLSFPWIFLSSVADQFVKQQTEIQRIKELSMGELPDPAEVVTERAVIQTGAAASRLTGITEIQNIPLATTRTEKASIMGFSPDTTPIHKMFARKLQRPVYITGGSLANKSSILSVQAFNSPLTTLPLTWKWAGYWKCLVSKCAIRVTGIDPVTGVITDTGGFPTLTFTYDTMIPNANFPEETLKTASTLLQRRLSPSYCLCRSDATGANKSFTGSFPASTTTFASLLTPANEPDGLNTRSLLCDIDTLEGETREEFIAQDATITLDLFMVAIRNKTSNLILSDVQTSQGGALLDLECVGTRASYSGICSEIFDRHYVRINTRRKTIDLIPRASTQTVFRVTIKVALSNDSLSSTSTTLLNDRSITSNSRALEGCPSVISPVTKELDGIELAITDNTRNATLLAVVVAVTGRHPLCNSFNVTVANLVQSATSSVNVPPCSQVHTLPTRIQVTVASAPWVTCLDWSGGQTASAIGNVNSGSSGASILPKPIIDGREAQRDRTTAIVRQIGIDAAFLSRQFSATGLNDLMQRLFNTRRAADFIVYRAQLASFIAAVKQFRDQSIRRAAENSQQRSSRMIAKFQSLSDKSRIIQDATREYLVVLANGAADEAVAVQQYADELNFTMTYANLLGQQVDELNADAAALATRFILNAPPSVNFSSPEMIRIGKLIGQGKFDPTIPFVAPQAELDAIARLNAATINSNCRSSGNPFCGQWYGVTWLITAAGLAFVGMTVTFVFYYRKRLERTRVVGSSASQSNA